MIPNPYILLVVVACFIANGFYWFDAGQTKANLEWTAKAETARANAEKMARDKERYWQGELNANVEHYQTQMSATRDKLATAVASLQSRSARRPDMPGDTEASSRCAGSTGAELSKPDGEFLAREAARADEIVGQLILCQGYARTVSK